MLDNLLTLILEIEILTCMIKKDNFLRFYNGLICSLKNNKTLILLVNATTNNHINVNQYKHITTDISKNKLAGATRLTLCY